MEFPIKIPIRGSSRSASTRSPTMQAGIRLENDRLILALATPCSSSNEQSPLRYDIRLETIFCEDSRGWLGVDRMDSLRETLVKLRQQHSLGQRPIALSLSGDHCVTRINSGTTEQVDSALEAVAERVPRYLQLGPGGKLVGQAREVIAPGMEHALTAVGNSALLNSLLQCLEQAGLRVAWMEPSLVSLARLVGLSGADQEEPVVIADSFGESWEVGISYRGRLMLDYRPAAAHDSNAFAEAIEQHLSRLQRFCGRHRGMDADTLRQVFVGGDEEKVTAVKSYLTSRLGKDSMTARALLMDGASLGRHGIMLANVNSTESDGFAGIAAILPMMKAMDTSIVPDLFERVRGNGPVSRWQRHWRCWWPLLAASLLIGLGYVLVKSTGRETGEVLAKREFIETQMRMSDARMSRLQAQRQFVSHLQSIEQQTFAPRMDEVTKRIASCLPISTYIRRIHMDGEGRVHLDAYSSLESDVYEVLGHLRGIPQVTQISLLGTMPDVEQGGSQFDIRLGWAEPSYTDDQPNTLELPADA
ncbi:MAG: hypothetical protein AAF670_16665 [Planctomycetota bacterium]